MQNQIKKAMGFAAVLLLLIVALMAAVITLVPVGADSESGSHTVTVKVEDGQTSRGTVKINILSGSSTGENTYEHGARIRVVASAQLGYMPKEIRIVRSTGSSNAQNPQRETEITWEGSVTEDIEITVSFTEKVYDLIFKPKVVNNLEWDDGVVPPSQYTFKTSITLPTPKNTAEYTFVGWSHSGKADEIISGDFSLNPGIADKEIVLWAIYKPNQFKVTRLDKDFKTGDIIGSYEFMADFDTFIKADATLLDKDENGNLFFKEYPGYTYQDKSDYYGGGTVSVAGVTITRYYIPNEYKITYDADGGNFSGSSVLVIFNQNVPDLNATELPTKPGYQFGGFWTRKGGYGVYGVQYVDKDGKGALWNIAEDTTLYALWVPQNISIDFSDALTEHATITVKQGNNTYTYDGTPLSFAYNTEITITIAAKPGYKLVQWNGNKVEHAAEAAFNYTIPAENQTLSGVVLQSCAVPEFSVDYTQETLLAEGTGDFELKCGDAAIPFKGGDKVSLKSFFGKEILVRRLGDGEQTSHSDWKKRQLASRPAAPIAADADENGKIQKPTIGETSILLELTDADTVDYEFAFRRFENEALVWQDAGNLTNLNAGTVYTVFIRVKATEDAPHGEEYSVSLTTLNENYLKGKIEELRGRIQKGDGQNVKNLIQSYIAKMEALQTGPDYQNKMDALIAECDNRLPLARYKDKRIAEIEARCEELRNGSLYNDAGKETLETLRANAVAEISDAASQSGVDTAFEDFGSEVAKIPVRIDLTWLFIALGTVILLQVVALVILLRRHAKYADRVKYVRDGKPVYGFVPLPVLAMTTRFLPEKSALVALLLGVVALVLQIVLVVLIFRTAAIAKKAKSNGGSAGTEHENGTQSPHDGATEAKSDSEPTADAFAFEPQVSVFHDDDASSFDHDNSADGLQEEDWYDENYEDDSSADTFESDDGEE